MKENVLIDKSIAFAARIIKLNQYLTKDKKEFIISKQIIRSGISIGQISAKCNMLTGKPTLLPNCKLHSKKRMKRDVGFNFFIKQTY